MAYEIIVATTMAITILFALSLNIITGFCGQVSLGHAAFYGLGAYTGAMLTKAGWPLIAALPPAAVVAGSVGFVVYSTSGYHTRLETGETPQRGCRAQRLLELSAMYFKVDRSAGRYTRHNSGCRAQPRWHLH